MPKPKSKAFARIREEVIRLVALIPEGKFTTYGSIATHMNVTAIHVSFVMSGLTEDESASLPWHRVVGADGRISRSMPPKIARLQRKRLEAEGMAVNAKGFIDDADSHYYFPGPRRSIRWSHG
jgi:methylated-DNA-protein-cysteine methyltransferase related protein